MAILPLRILGRHRANRLAASICPTLNPDGMKNDIKQLISQNQLFQAIRALEQARLRPKNRKQLAVVESRLNEINEKIRIGVVSEENANIELNRIRKSLFELCEAMETPEERKRRSRMLPLLIGGGLLVVAILAVVVSSFQPGCENRKIAVLVANFLNEPSESGKRDGFSNNLVTKMDLSLHDSLYDISPVGFQTRQIRRYHEFIEKEYFEASCDTSGIFVNGLMDKENEIFNAYITFCNLKMEVPELSGSNAISMNNPEGIDFSVKEESSFLAELLIAILKMYEGDTESALSDFFTLEKEDEAGLTREDESLRSTLAYYKGTCYAMRGDNERAKQQYNIVAEKGAPELVEAAEQNKKVADEVTARMEEDPELRESLKRNRQAHSQFERDLAAALRKIGRAIGREFRKLKLR